MSADDSSLIAALSTSPYAACLRKLVSRNLTRSDMWAPLAHPMLDAGNVQAQLDFRRRARRD